MRLWAATYMSEDAQEANQKFRMAWQLSAEVFSKINNDRKESAIPGSAVQQPVPVLFGKEDLTTLQLAQKVNSAGKGTWRPNQGKSYRFRGFKGNGFSGFRGTSNFNFK